MNEDEQDLKANKLQDDKNAMTKKNSNKDLNYRKARVFIVTEKRAHNTQ